MTGNAIITHIKMLPEFFRQVCTGYAQVYFSRRWLIGLIFCAATFIVPAQGAAGLAGLLLANLFALLLGLSREQIRQGYFAYNGLLTGLALGLTYSMNVYFAIMLALVSLLCVLVAAVVRALHDRYLFIPVLSIPFVITSWIAILAGQKFQGLIYTTSPFEVSFLAGVFPETFEYVIRTLGAAFFQLSVPAGLLVAAGLFLYSRQAFFLAVVSILVSSRFYILLGGAPSDLNGSWIGFNFALTAIATGGYFVVPGIGSYILGISAALLSALVAAGSTIILSGLGVPVLAMPFLIVTLTIVFALKNRVSQRLIPVISFPLESPEKNLKYWKNMGARYARGDIPAFELPVRGEWTVTQGFEGDDTHRGAWAHAWDLEAKDHEGRTCKNGGNAAGDYYAWNMPVFAPADGKVFAVINHIEDNPVGQVNTRDNWGNTIVVWHYGAVYTAVSHLSKGSAAVREGDLVRRGQLLGRVGNSGRSPVPHLHFQAQTGHPAGSPTAQSEMLHYLVRKDSGWAYHTHGVPETGDIIRPLETEELLFDAASFPVGGLWKYEARNLKGSWTETWETRVDFSGNRFLVCRENGARLQVYVDGRVLVMLDYQGPRETGLARLFLAVPRMPFGWHDDVRWEEELPADMLLNPAARFLFDALEPFIPLARLKSVSRFRSKNGDAFSLETDIAFSGVLAGKSEARASIVSTFCRYKGLTSLSVIKNNSEIFSLTQKGNGHEE